jgi:hypothetical protein
MNYYKVVFDSSDEVVETKALGPAPDETRTVCVVANSPQEARKKARILVGTAGSK